MPGALTGDYDNYDPDADPDADDPDATAAVPAPGAVASPSGALSRERLNQIYANAEQRIKAQRSGLSPRELLGIALTGFAQPTRHGKFGESVANASQLATQYLLKARERDQTRRDKLDALGLTRDVALARSDQAYDIAAMKANKPPKLANDSDQRMRLGYAQRLFPNLTPEQIAAQNLLYDPRVDRQMLRIYGARAAAGAGEPLDDLPPDAPAVPPLAQWLEAARKANPGTPDADLTAFYHQKYGG